MNRLLVEVEILLYLWRNYGKVTGRMLYGEVAGRMLLYGEVAGRMFL